VLHVLADPGGAGPDRVPGVTSPVAQVADGTVDPCLQHVQVQQGRGERLDGVVVEVGGQAAALVLLRGDDLA
jgi:hypothetical protein